MLVLKEIKDRKGYMILNRPEKRNALSYDLVSELKSTLDELLNDKNVKVIILKSKGSFCAGADLEYIQQLQQNSHEENLEDSQHLRELFQSIYLSNKIIIAQVSGHAIAGGCGLAAVCDYSFAGSSTKMGFTEVRIGFVPALVSVFLVKKIGEGRTREILLSGELYSASKMMDFGLINGVEDDLLLEQKVEEFSDRLIKNNAAESMRMTKDLIHQVSALNFDQALDFAAEVNAKARKTEDCKRGLEAFLGKKKIEW